VVDRCNADCALVLTADARAAEGLTQNNPLNAQTNDRDKRFITSPFVSCGIHNRCRGLDPLDAGVLQAIKKGSGIYNPQSPENIAKL
jgi:hypothetical protein